MIITILTLYLGLGLLIVIGFVCLAIRVSGFNEFKRLVEEANCTISEYIFKGIISWPIFLYAMIKGFTEDI